MDREADERIIPGWYTITPAGPVAIGNLTPVGQNSGQVGCRWPPNGHQLAACVNLPTEYQLWGPFWYFRDSMYVTLPQLVYCLESEIKRSPNGIPQQIFRMEWREGQWQVRSPHQEKKEKVVQIGGQYLIQGKILKDFWKEGQRKNLQLEKLPWQTLTLSHNSRKDYRVKDEGGFFAEMTTLLAPRWSILVKVIDKKQPEYQPEKQSKKVRWGCLGAGGTPVAISPVQVLDDWLNEKQTFTRSAGAILLTAALWQKKDEKVSCPVPPFPIKAYAAEMGIPWQSWKNVKHAKEKDIPNAEKRVEVLTPGEWIAPAGAVYLWEGTVPLEHSQPLLDRYYRHVLGYGHLWLFEDQLNGN